MRRLTWKGKWIVGLLALVMLFSPTTSLAKQPTFTDIETSFAREAIHFVYGQGIMQGISPTSFAPEQQISRKHFAVVLAKTLGVQPIYPEQATFTDITSGQAEYGYIEALVHLGILTGTSKTTFGGDLPLTRQDATVIITRALGEEGLMDGYKNSPKQTLSRAEVAVIAQSLFEHGNLIGDYFWGVEPTQLELKVGEQKQLKLLSQDAPLAYTPIYGLDNPDLGTISPEGVFTATAPGKGLITVNIGDRYHQVAVTVREAAEAVADSSLADSVLTGEYSYTVESIAPDAAFQRMEYKNYPGPVDGLLSTSEAWTGFFRQEGRQITIDLGAMKKLSGVSLEFQQKKASGISLPNYMEASLSQDGKKWSHLGRASHLVPGGDLTEQTRRLQLSFPSIEARYIQVSFPVDVWVFARNLVINTEDDQHTADENMTGTSSSQKPVILAHQSQHNQQSKSYLQIPGVDDILLIYTGAHGDLGMWQEKDFLPLATYVDQQGNIQDKLFDTFLFLPFPEVESTKLSWQDYLNGLFQEGEQLDALNQLALKLQQDYPQLKIRPQVILTLPYPNPKQEEFYPGISFSTEQVGRQEALTNRQRAVKDYLNTLMSMWQAAQYEAIDLVGIYWYQETMDAAIPDEDKLVRYAADLVHEADQKFYWIPYFGSKGYEQWKEYGFDYVILQPNFYAQDDPPKERMDNLASLAKEFHLGVELEIDEKVTYNRFYYDLFYEQLNMAYELGIDKEVTNAYYMGAKTLLHTANSKIGPVREIYDDLYRWIKGMYQTKDPNNT